MTTAKKKFIELDYEALEAQTSAEFVEQVKYHCDSEKHGYLNRVVRSSTRPTVYKDSESSTLSLYIVSYSKHIRHNFGHYHCHWFYFESEKPTEFFHVESILSVVNEFAKLAAGLKDG